MQAWNLFLENIEKELGKSTTERWLKPLQIARFDARNLYLEASDPLQISWFEEHIRPLVKRLTNNNGQPIQVILSLPQIQEALKPKSSESSFAIFPDRLDPELKLENFLTTPRNMVAYKLLCELDKPSFNPIFLYGPKTSGKSHLLNAAALFLEAKGKKVFYVRAESFTTHVVQAIRLGQMKQFRSIYREIDALIVDDVDVFAKKDATQEEFFHTFNTLHLSGKQILLSAELPPSKLSDIEPRLLSRFEWGLSIGIEPIDPKELLQQKASLWKLSFSPELIQHLCHRFPQNALMALQALSLRSKGLSSILPEKADQLLSDLIQTQEIPVLTPEKITSQIASYYGIKVEDILGKSQAREHAFPRQIAMFLCREKLELAYQKIGEIFGRDHSTVMSSVRQIQKLLQDTESPVFQDLQSIKLNL